MAISTTSNPCSRCGKQRITKKTKTEKIGNSEITYAWTICPDPECQKKVDRDIAVAKKKREDLKTEADKRHLMFKN